MTIRPARLHRRRNASAGALAVAIAAALAQLPATPAGADNSSTLTVVGTSDVFDSNLIQSVIKPGFEHAYPQYTLNYVSKGTGAAIQYAEAGTASALLVHAASLENQFVASGYSLEQYGRAIFYGDYVLLGPANDPANVLTTAPHDIVKAFELIADAGGQGRANFVSRGGTPGTTVEEHLLWALSQGVTTCDVSAANGGGKSPSTATGDCPQSISYPSWYHATGLTQGPNIENADVCNYSGGGCYVLTDRGTFSYLQSTHAISNLQIVTRDNAPWARGGATALVNSFHAYGINPTKFSGDAAAQINTTAAKAFLDWITSPAAQQAVGAFLDVADDAPFLPDSVPVVRPLPTLPASVKPGTLVAVSGMLANVVPGTPPLAHVPVRLVSRAPAKVRGADLGAPQVIATTNTDATGGWSFTFKSSTTASYSVAWDGITQVEDATLSPIFGDLLQPGEVALGSVRVVGVPKITAIALAGRTVRMKVTLAPAPAGYAAAVKVYVGRLDHALRLVRTIAVRAGQRTLGLTVPMRGPGEWTLKLTYVSAAQFSAGSTPVQAVIVH